MNFVMEFIFNRYWRLAGRFSLDYLKDIMPGHLTSTFG